MRLRQLRLRMSPFIDIRDKKILVISDLHLGDGTKSDDFQFHKNKRIKHAEKKLLDWIQSIDVDLLVLAGDIEELWQHKQKKVHRVYKKFFEFLKTHDHIRIVGNHDIQVLGRESLVLRYNDTSIYIAHGHQGNKQMRNPLLKLIVRIIALVEKIFPNIDELSKFAFKTKEEGRTTAFAETRLQKHDIVILGHSHQPGQVLPGYYNSGCCQHGRREGVLIENGRVSLVSAVPKTD